MKKFFGFILVLAIIGGIVYFVMNNQNAKNGSGKQSTTVEKEDQGVWDSVSSTISTGIEAVGSGIKAGIDKVKGDSDGTESNKKGSKAKESEADKDIFDLIGDTFQSGKESVESIISNHETATLTGKLVVKGKGKNLKCYLKTGLFEKYTVKTLTGTQDSYLKIAGYKGKKVKISGIVNTETKEITVASYKLAD